jgi:nitrogenase subunit NifH
MFDERTNLAQQVKTELKNFFGDKLCTTTIPRNIRLAEAPSHGKAALVYDPRSKGAESYIKLAKEIIERQAPGSLQSSVHGVEIGIETPTTEEAIATVERSESVEEMPAKDEMDKTA